MIERQLVLIVFTKESLQKILVVKYDAIMLIVYYKGTLIFLVLETKLILIWGIFFI